MIKLIGIYSDRSAVAENLRDCCLSALPECKIKILPTLKVLIGEVEAIVVVLTKFSEFYGSKSSSLGGASHALEGGDPIGLKEFLTSVPRGVNLIICGHPSLKASLEREAQSGNNQAYAKPRFLPFPVSLAEILNAFSA